MRVFVFSPEGKPLMPTTPARARKLLQAGVARQVWSKFNTFGIQMLVEVGAATQPCAMGVDQGTKFEGYSVVCSEENVLNIKLDLPSKSKIVAKIDERRRLRRERRRRTCRRRKARFHNRRRRSNWLAPSQRVVVQSRLKVVRELARLYPLTKAGLEDVCFNHRYNRWGANFSTVEIGKAWLRQTFSTLGITLHEYRGWETKEARERYGYKKCADKATDQFESHCSDSLALACLVLNDTPIQPGTFLVVDDTYRCVRRRLFDTQFSKGGVKFPYSRGTVQRIQKGRMIGNNTKCGLLVGQTGKHFYLRCYTGSGRTTLVSPTFVSTHFQCKGG